MKISLFRPIKSLFIFLNEQVRDIDKKYYLILIGMFYMTIFFSSFVMGYKTIDFHGYILCASVLIFPVLFPINDSITEFFGAKTSYLMIAGVIVCEFLFSFITRGLASMPSPAGWQHQELYSFITKGYIHIAAADSVSLAIGFAVNTYFLNKWGKLLYGRNFFIRSVGATAIGELIFTISTNSIAFFHVAKFGQIANIVFSDYIFKMLYSLIICLPNAFIVYKIKQSQHTQKIEAEDLNNTKIIRIDSNRKFYSA